MTTQAQILALQIVGETDGCSVEPAAFSDAEFFGVYLGHAGAFVWQTDFDTHAEALKEAQDLVAAGKADEVLDESRKYGE